MGSAGRQRNQTRRPDRLGRSAVVALCCLLALTAGSGFWRTASAQDVSDGWQIAEFGSVRFHVQDNNETSAADFAALNGPFVETGLEEMLLFLNVPESVQPIEIYAYADSAAYHAAVEATGRLEPDDMFAVADPPNAAIHILLDSFVALTPSEAENRLRHAVSHIVVGWATDFKMPRGFDEGLAQYAERPNGPEQARLAAVVQTAHQAGKLASWSNLNRATPFDDETLIQAESYSAVAYLLKHHGLTEFWRFLEELKTAESWREAMNVAFAPADSDNIERQWKDDVPLWAAGEWRWNLIAGFDLRPATEQLTRGNFEGAASELEVSETLLRDVDDPERLAEVTRLKDQARIGQLAEAKMLEAQQALEQFVYDRAAAAVAQAEEQYKQLPPELRPDDTIEVYKEMAERGLKATENLEIARIQAGNWSDYPEARASALSAGESFASLGDDELRNQSASLIDQMDQEQLRLVLLLAALALLTAAWLGLWLWSRGPPAVKWD